MKEKIRGALAIAFLYLCIMVMLFIILYPVQIVESHSIAYLIVGYVLFFLALSVVIIPIFVSRYQTYPGRFVVVSFILFMGAFNILLGMTAETVDMPLLLAFYVGIISIAFGSRLYSRVIREVSTEKARIDAEITLAQKIQTDLLPVIDIDEDKFQAFGRTINAHEVGGDLFDVVRLSNNRVAFCVGDVSGHNVGAGLIMGIVKSAFRVELRYNENLSSIAASLNRTVIEQRSKGMFVSFAAGIIDFEEGQMDLVNAGHPPLIHIQGRSVSGVKTEGVALGLSDHVNFSMGKRRIANGDVILCYSDGLIEARNTEREEFGYERLLNLLRYSVDQLSAREWYDLLYGRVNEFIRNQPRVDDITVLVLKIK